MGDLSAASKPVILVLEDEPDLLHIISTAVDRQLDGYEVVGVGSVRDASARLDELEGSGRRLALAMVDHLLAGTRHDDAATTGLGLLEQIRARFPDASTILFTGQASPQIEQRARAGGTRVLWKPLRLSVLLSEVADALA